MTPRFDPPTPDPVLAPLAARLLASSAWARCGADVNAYWDIQCLKHHVGRRLTLRLAASTISRGEHRVMIAKIYYNRRAERIHRMLKRLHDELARASDSPPRIPAPVFHDPDAHAYVYPALEGTPLTEALRRGERKTWLEPLLHAMFALARCQVDDLPARTAVDELECVARLIDDSEHPGETAPCRFLLDSLARIIPPCAGTGPIHRDLYDQQILQCPDGGLALLDLDDAALGDPMLDLGNFVAHLSLIDYWHNHGAKLGRLRHAMLRRWAGNGDVEPASLALRFAWYEAIALCRLATLQLRRGRTGLSHDLIARARNLIASDGAQAPSRLTACNISMNSKEQLP